MGGRAMVRLTFQELAMNIKRQPLGARLKGSGPKSLLEPNNYAIKNSHSLFYKVVGS